MENEDGVKLKREKDSEVEPREAGGILGVGPQILA